MNKVSISVEGVVVEIQDTEAGFHFRMVEEETGHSSSWAGYCSIAGICSKGKWFYAATSYYVSDPKKELVPIPGDEILSYFVVK